MGFFGRFVYSDGRWHDEEPSSPYLMVDIHDSDIATVDCVAPAATGRFYLGYEPRHYFEDPSANEPVDTRAMAEGFAAWVDQVVGASVSRRRVERLLASPQGRDPKDDFVEDTVGRLLRLAGVPLPGALNVG